MNCVIIKKFSKVNNDRVNIETNIKFKLIEFYVMYTRPKEFNNFVM